MSDKSNDAVKKSGGEEIRDHPVISSVVLSAAFAFTLLFFSPMEIFLRNHNEFVVGLKYIAPPMLLTSLVAAAAAEAIFLLLLRLKRTAFDVVTRLVFGFLLALYLQGLLFNGKMVSLADTSSAYAVSEMGKTINFLVNYVIFFLPVVLYAAGSKKPDSRLFMLERRRGILCISGAVFVMQTAGLLGTSVSTDLGGMRDVYNHNLSYGPVMTVSEEQNILVFVFDRMDGFWTDDVLEAYPELYEELNGFTYYQNNISHYTNTFPSLPKLVTGIGYHDDNGTGYLRRAWDSETTLDRLKADGWNVGLVIDRISTYDNIKQLENRCDNIREDNENIFRINYLRKDGIVPTMARLSLIKHAPYMLKNPLAEKITSDFSVGFIEADSDDIVPSAIGTGSDLKFYSYLKEYGLNVVPEGKCYRFIHLNGIHEADERIAAIYEKNEGSSFSGSFRGAMEIILEYLRQLRANGVYDNTTVIILGDHARPMSDSGGGLSSPLVTGLMIKPAGAPDEPLKTDSSSELSNDFLEASLLEYAGMEHSAYGPSYNDVTENDLRPDRFMQTFIYKSGRSVEYWDLYKVTGDARDLNNWEVQPEHE